MTTVLITGANRGIGLEFVKQYAEDGAKVIACCRTPDTATDLQALAKDFDWVSVHALDVTSDESVAGLREVMAALTPERSGRFWNYNGEELPW